MAEINTTEGLQRALASELFTRCISADDQGFTLHRYLGTYRQHFIRTQSGWQCDRSTDTAPVLALTAQVRQFVARFPELQATYPHKVAQDERSITPKDEAWVISEAAAEIQVPAAFVSRYSGSEYMQQLMQDSPGALTQLCEAVKQRLQRYEIRTARMFLQGGTHLHIGFTVTADAIETQIWHLPTEAFGLAPLFQSHQRCGLARAMAQSLADALSCQADVFCSVPGEEEHSYTVQLTIKDL